MQYCAWDLLRPIRELAYSRRLWTKGMLCVSVIVIWVENIVLFVCLFVPCMLPSMCAFCVLPSLYIRMSMHVSMCLCVSEDALNYVQWNALCVYVQSNTLCVWMYAHTYIHTHSVHLLTNYVQLDIYTTVALLSLHAQNTHYIYMYAMK